MIETGTETIKRIGDNEFKLAIKKIAVDVKILKFIAVCEQLMCQGRKNCDSLPSRFKHILYFGMLQKYIDNKYPCLDYHILIN